ncbi:MAG: discoidin domain-containing protein [Gammaproteobacteria bacterium]
MKPTTLTLAIVLLGSGLQQAGAAQIPFIDVTATGTFVNSLTLLTNGIFPGEGSAWNSAATVQFTRYSAAADTEYFVFDMGALFTVTDIVLSVDNNDSYTIEYGTNGSTWSTLTVADRTFGEVGNGMDTLSSVAGNAEYVAGMDFPPSGPARYLRVYVDGWGNVPQNLFSDPYVGDGAFAIGEFQAFGEVYVPLPAAWLLGGSALAGLAGYTQRRAAHRDAPSHQP